MPIVIRVPYGGGIGAVEHHSESPEAYFCHTPGLKVVTCSNPADAYWMIQQAIASDDPIIFFEPKRAITSGLSSTSHEAAAIAFRTGGATWNRRHDPRTDQWSRPAWTRPKPPPRKVMILK